METTTIKINQNQTRQAALNGLAIVGFIALVIIGMTLAVYAARYIPKAVSGIGGANVSLASLFGTTTGSNTLQVVPTQTVPFDDSGSSLVATTTATTTPTVATKPKPAAYTGTGSATPGTQTTVATPINGSVGTVAPATLYGLPNLVTTITSVGYLDNSNTFIPSSIVPSNMRLAIKFTIANAGTNVATSWHLSATLPTTFNSNFTYTSNVEPVLNPGEHVDFTLHLDPGQAEFGDNETVSVTADSNHEVVESNENNTATASVNVR